MNIWHDIGEERIFPTDFMAVIEIQKGSNMKYEMDKETGMLMLDRVLFHSHPLSHELWLYPPHVRGRQGSRWMSWCSARRPLSP